MSDFTDVALVDGVGTRKVITIPASEVAPITLRFPHQGTTKTSSQVLVQFDRANGEQDADGRPVYRMRGSGLPAIRIKVRPSEPSINRPRWHR